ncbi:MAG: hypothetical protein ACK5S9_13625 [Roseiflexaceae bacterium]|jgi:hypothetical protein
MARLSRADRKRINARSNSALPDIDVPAAYVPPVVDVAASSEPKTLRTTRRVGKLTADTINYTAEYAVIGHDLRRIGFWGTLLMVAVIALSFSGLV